MLIHFVIKLAQQVIHHFIQYHIIYYSSHMLLKIQNNHYLYFESEDNRIEKKTFHIIIYTLL